MSSMLEQAIIDAEALREVALKNAEASVIEKYSTQIKEAVEEILNTTPLNEEEEEEETVVDEVDYAAADDNDDDDDCPCPDKEQEEVVLDLTDLLGAMKNEEQTEGLDHNEMLQREEVAEEIVPEENETMDEEVELDESFLESLLETEEENQRRRQKIEIAQKIDILVATTKEITKESILKSPKISLIVLWKNLQLTWVLTWLGGLVVPLRTRSSRWKKRSHIAAAPIWKKN